MKGVQRGNGIVTRELCIDQSLTCTRNRKKTSDWNQASDSGARKERRVKPGQLQARLPPFWEGCCLLFVLSIVLRGYSGFGLGVTPGGVWGTVFGARHLTQVSSVQYTTSLALKASTLIPELPLQLSEKEVSQKNFPPLPYLLLVLSYSCHQPDQKGML